jgi:hypothetical protein
VLLLELWTWPGCALFLVWPNVYVLAASILPTALAIPSTDSVVHGYRIALTPDRLLGRAESVWATIPLLTAPLGPLAAGALLDATSAADGVAADPFGHPADHRRHRRLLVVGRQEQHHRPGAGGRAGAGRGGPGGQAEAGWHGRLPGVGPRRRTRLGFRLT